MDGTILTSHRSFCGVFLFSMRMQGDEKSTDILYLRQGIQKISNMLPWPGYSKNQQYEDICHLIPMFPIQEQKERESPIEVAFCIRIKRRVPKKTIRLWD